jgi:hypothetical protein
LLLATRAWNVISLDTLLSGAANQGGAKTAAGR